jgi:uncharacterized membrane protein
MLNAACYGAFKRYVDNIVNIDKVDELLQAIEPHILQGLTEESIKMQAKLLTELYRHVTSESTNQSLSGLKYKKEIEELLRSNTATLNEQLKGFDGKLTNFRVRLRSWAEDSSNDTFSGAYYGGFIGGILGGPIGAVIGGIIGGSGDGAADTEFKREFQSLVSAYQAIINNAESCLDNCFDDCKECLIEMMKNASPNDDNKKKMLNAPCMTEGPRNTVPPIQNSDLLSQVNLIMNSRGGNNQ